MGRWRCASGVARVAVGCGSVAAPPGGGGGTGCVRARVAIFFFQAEDGIRDYKVTGVQTCALPIFELDLTAFEGTDAGAFDIRAEAYAPVDAALLELIARPPVLGIADRLEKLLEEIGRASCRKRV